MPVPVNYEAQVSAALAELKVARLGGDELKIDLAQAALNDLIDRNLIATEELPILSQLPQLSKVGHNNNGKGSK